MASRFYNLPSLNGLAAFEAAGRHMSLTRAAAELNVTPGAISKHIKSLEMDIGTDLFVRLHRSIELTAEGSALLVSLKQSFGQLASTLDGLREGGPKKVVTIGSTNAFAQFWLMPRLGRFWKHHQDIVVDHVISDRTQDSPGTPVELRVRYGSGQFHDETAQKLFDDVILPVAAPDFIASQSFESLSDIAALPLLSVEGVDWSWTTWAEFLRHGGVAPRRLAIRRFNSYVIAIQAALDGQGVALGWKRLIEPLIRDGKLVALDQHEMPAPQGFYLTWSTRRSLSPEATVLRDWLLDQVA
jgi:DNA-binding transcriptional LysR family regulator